MSLGVPGMNITEKRDHVETSGVFKERKLIEFFLGDEEVDEACAEAFDGDEHDGLSQGQAGANHDEASPGAEEVARHEFEGLPRNEGCKDLQRVDKRIPNHGENDVVANKFLEPVRVRGYACNEPRHEGTEA